MSKKLCPVCKGSGMEEIKDWGAVYSKICRRCNGSGKLDRTDNRKKDNE